MLEKRIVSFIYYAFSGKSRMADLIEDRKWMIYIFNNFITHSQTQSSYQEGGDHATLSGASAGKSNIYTFKKEKKQKKTHLQYSYL